MDSKTIAIDVDWVVAKLLKKWVKTYNAVFQDNLTLADVTSWDMRKVVKEEARPYIFNILQIPGFYRGLELVEGCQEVIKWLSENHEVIFVTDPFVKESLVSKYEMLTDNFPSIPKKNIVLTGNKSIIKADYLIDDGVHNFEGFIGTPILFDAPYNKNATEYFRVKSWDDIRRVFENTQIIEEFYRER